MERYIFMRHTRILAALLAFALLLSLTGCGGKTTATEPVQTAAEETTAREAAYYNEKCGLIIRQWPEAFQPYAQGLFTDGGALDGNTGDYMGMFLGCDIVDSDNTGVTAFFALIICSTNPEAKKERAEALAKELGLIEDAPDATLEEFTTKSGQTLWIVRYVTPEGGAFVSGDPTPEQQAGIDAMLGQLDDLLAECEVVEPLRNTGGKVRFTTVDLDGNTVDSSVFANAEYTMINIWGSFCAPCIGEMEDLMQMDAEMENVQIITILGDAMNVTDDTAEDAREIVEKLHLTLPVYLINRQIMEQFPFDAFPTSFMVDREGTPLGRPCVGAVGPENYQKWMQSCIGG